MTTKKKSKRGKVIGKDIYKPNVPPANPTPPGTTTDYQGYPGYPIAPGCKSIDPLAPLESLDRWDYPNAAKVIPTLFNQRPPIDSGIKAIRNVSTAFRYHQVEQLLAQASTLFERAIAARSEWQALGDKSFAQWLELMEFIDIEAIHNDETSHGYYEMDWLSSRQKEDTELLSGADIELDLLRRGIGLQDPNKPLPKAGDIQLGDLNVATPLIEGHNLETQSDVSESNLNYAQTSTAYENCNIGYRRKRTEASRRISALKAQAYTEPSGPYNYEERRYYIQKRFAADFKDAQSRLATVSRGLKLIYGYDMDLPDGDSIFDKTLIAVRGALEWLVKFTGQEQNYILPISVRRLALDSWVGGLRSDGRAGAWNFQLPETFFPQQSHVRLRGISGSVDTQGVNDFFQLVTRLPQTASIRFLDGSAHQLDQTAVPVTRIARLQGRSCVRPPDVVGVLSLHNVSPISVPGHPWRVVITSSAEPLQIGANPTQDNPNPNAEFIGSNSKIEDVILFLHLAVRTDLPRRR